MTRTTLKPKQRWILFSRGCLHGVRRSDLTVIRSQPRHMVSRSTISVFSVSRTSALLASAALLALVIYCLAGCIGPAAQKGGMATTEISRAGHSSSTTLVQPENPEKPSRQTVESDQTLEYVLPAGTVLLDSSTSAAPAMENDKLIRRRVSGRRALADNSDTALTNIPGIPNAAILERPVTVRLVAKDRTETVFGVAQRDTARDWMARAATLKPVMFAGILLMTLGAGVLGYFGWWTKAALAAGVGLGMIVLAQVLPGKENVILFGGLAVFGLAALLVLYAYHKGMFDQNHNGIPDFLDRQTKV